MANEIIEAEFKSTSDITVSDHSIKALGERIEKMKVFVSAQMVKGIDNDYAIIPGTKKMSLLKPGAEKLLLLFNLGFKFNILNQVIDLYGGEVSFLIECKVFRKNDAVVVGEYMGFCSNKEKKYEKQNPSDMVNTILKMCQKRALVGATIAATGASDYFTQDLEDMEGQRKAPADATKFVKKEGEDNASYVVKIGKFTGKKLSEINPRELSGYVEYCVSQAQKEGKAIDGDLKTMIDKSREYLRTAGAA
jgi:hypothetical protein